MALSCHLSMDHLCQEMRDACGESSESLGFQRSLCSECQEGRRRCSDAQVSSYKVKIGLHAGDSFEHFCAFFGMRAFFHFDVSLFVFLLSWHVAERRCSIGLTISFPCPVVGPALLTFASFILSHEPPT